MAKPDFHYVFKVLQVRFRKCRTLTFAFYDRRRAMGSLIFFLPEKRLLRVIILR